MWIRKFQAYVGHSWFVQFQTQDFYLSQIERITKKYFYSVNRHKYKMHKYNAQGFYNLKFKKRWSTIVYDFTHTFQLEFLGKIEE